MDPDTQRMFDSIGAQAQKITSQMESVSGTGSDDDGLVTATCGPGNRLTGIEFDPRARRLDTHDLSEKVLVAVQRAGEASQKSLMDVIGGFSGQVGDLNVPNTSELMKNMEEAQAQIAEQRKRLEEVTQRLQKP